MGLKLKRPTSIKIKIMAAIIAAAVSMGLLGEVFWRYVYSNSHTPARIYNLFGKMYFVGGISAGDAGRVIKEFESAWVKPTAFVVNSVGGDIYEGMKIGLIIRQKNMNVEVYDRCISSCANYIFPAGTQKYLGKNSLIGWHGSPGSAPDFFFNTVQDQSIVDGEMVEITKTFTMKSLPEAYRKSGNVFLYEKLKTLDAQFYMAIGVSQLLPVCGQKQNVQNFDLEKLNNENGIVDGYLSNLKNQYYYYSLEDMERFGVKNIFLVDEEVFWQKHQNENNSIQAKFCEKLY